MFEYNEPIANFWNTIPGEQQVAFISWFFSASIFTFYFYLNYVQYELLGYVEIF